MRLKELRKAASMTQAELAEKSGLNLRTLQDYEQGQKPLKSASYERVEKIADALGVDMKDLF